jgi:hypothetical protein
MESVDAKRVGVSWIAGLDVSRGSSPGIPWKILPPSGYRIQNGAPLRTDDLKIIGRSMVDDSVIPSLVSGCWLWNMRQKVRLELA